MKGHSRGDQNHYRNKEEERLWHERDPIERQRDRIIRSKLLPAEVLSGDRSGGARASQRCIEKCRKLPPVRVESAFEKIYGPPPEIPADVKPAVEPTVFEQKPYWQAVQEAMCEAMDKDETLFRLGEDVAEYGGCFKVTRGMYEKYRRYADRQHADQ